MRGTASAPGRRSSATPRLTSALVDEVPLGAQSNVLPEVERQLAHFARMFVALHAPHLDRVEADARIHLALGVALSTCLRIAVDPPPGIAEDRLLDSPDSTPDTSAVGRDRPRAGTRGPGPGPVWVGGDQPPGWSLPLTVSR